MAQSLLNSKIAIILFIATYLTLLQFTTQNIIGFDAFSHTKIAELTLTHGVSDFTWLPFTILTTNYANTQILFHLLLIPFTAGTGPKIAAVLFSTLFFTLVHWFLRKNNSKQSGFYTVLLLVGSTDLTYRFLLTRPFVLGLACFILTLYFIQTKKYKSLMALFFIYSLLYSGFIFGLVAVILYYLISIFYKKNEYKLLLFSLIGTIAGLIVSPSFPANLSFLFTQWFQVNLTGNFFNQEWRAWSLVELIQFSWIFLILFFSSLFLIMRKKAINQKNIFYAVLTTLFFVALLTSRRFLEYFAPLSIILFALAFNKPFLHFIKKNTLKKYVHYGIFIILFILVAFNIVVVRQDIKHNDFFHRFDNCISWAEEHIPENSLIFNNGYTFNYFFYRLSHLTYTHGLDLTYSYLHDEEKFNRYTNALQGKPVEGNIVIQDYNADYVLIGKIKQDIQLFNYLNQHNDDFELAYDDLDCTVLQVKK